MPSGQLLSPDGTFNALRETQVGQTDTYINGSLSSSTITHDFSWLTKAHGDFNVFIDTSSKISGDVSVYQPLLNLVENYPTAVNESTSNIPEKYELFQNYPNPFNPTTTITYSLPKNSFVTLTIYDLLGREVATLVNEEKHSGTYKVTWNAQNKPSGIYFYKITAGGYSKINKMILLK